MAGVLRQGRLELADVAVGDHLDDGALTAEVVDRHLHALMNLLVHEHNVPRANQDGQRGYVTQRGGRRDEDVATEHVAQAMFELGVRRSLQVNPGGCELSSVTPDRLAYTGLQAGIEFEP